MHVNVAWPSWSAKISFFFCYRGFVQRKKFEKILENHRLEENQREIIENFANLIQKLKDNSMMQPISFSVEEHVETIDMKRRKMDEQTRRERSLQMRELYAERQNNWEMFRQAEKQRRIDKAQQEKMDYMNGILLGKDERRQYHIEQFQYTNNVRSHFQAASIIQKAYRQYRERKNWWKRVKEAGLARDRAKKSFAAGVIQCSWRKHKDWKKFEATYMCSVHTNPVVQLSKRPLFELASDKGLKSYERSTLTSGNVASTITMIRCRLVSYPSSFVMRQCLGMRLDAHSLIWSQYQDTTLHC